MEILAAKPLLAEENFPLPTILLRHNQARNLPFIGKAITHGKFQN